MMVGGFAPFMFLAALGNPVIVVSAVAVGAVARRWWHLLPGSLVPPLACWLFYASDGFWELLPFLIAPAAIWSAATFAIRRIWTS